MEPIIWTGPLGSILGEVGTSHRQLTPSLQQPYQEGAIITLTLQARNGATQTLCNFSVPRVSTAWKGEEPGFGPKCLIRERVCCTERSPATCRTHTHVLGRGGRGRKGDIWPPDPTPGLLHILHGDEVFPAAPELVRRDSPTSHHAEGEGGVKILEEKLIYMFPVAYESSPTFKCDSKQDPLHLSLCLHCS